MLQVDENIEELFSKFASRNKITEQLVFPN